MNENEYYWEDRFLDVLRQFDSGDVWNLIERRMNRELIDIICPALRLAVALDRPDLIAPALQHGNNEEALSLASITWENGLYGEKCGSSSNRDL